MNILDNLIQGAQQLLLAVTRYRRDAYNLRPFETSIVKIFPDCLLYNLKEIGFDHVCLGEGDNAALYAQ